MPNSYWTNFDRLRLDPGFSNVLAALERGFQQFQIDYYLVGAVSRNVWLSGINNITPKRTTGDVDFAVFINDRGLYEQLKQYLFDKEKFQPYTQNAFVLIWEDGSQIDLLPFGAIEDEDRKVTIQGTGFTSVHVEGFKEVYDQDLPQIELDGGYRFKCCTLPGIVLLKLIAWDDRPEARQDDIKDIAEILDHFFEINREMIWNEYSDLFDNPEPLDDGRSGLLLIAAHVLGKELRKIANENEHLLNRLKNIIGRNAVDASSSKMGEIMAVYFEMTVAGSLWLIKEIEKGLTV